MSNNTSHSSHSPYRVVKKVFEQVWSDFYAWSPPCNLPLDITKVTASLEDNPAYHVFKKTSRVARHTPTTALRPAVLHEQRLLENLAGKSVRSVMVARSSYALTNTTSAIPRYPFCMPIRANIATEEEQWLPFLPILDDDTEFSEQEYERLFNHKIQAAVPGRDPAGESIS